MAADLEFRIGAELTEIKGALAGLQRDLRATGQAAQKAGGGAFQGLEASARTAITAVQGLVAAVAGLQVAGKFIQLADEAQNLTGRLRLATTSQQEFAEALAGVQRVASATRQPITAVGDTYARLAQNISDTPTRLLALTETISKAIALSGTSAQAGEAALIQFAQGLSAGALRGDEFNSVAEQAPRLLRALQDGLGKTRGELRKLADDGKLTTDELKRALQNQAQAIDSEFAKLPTTIGQSFTLLQNAALQYVGILDESNGISATFATSMKALADNFAVLAGAIALVIGLPLAIALGRAAAGLALLAKGLTAAAGAATVLRGAIAFLGGPVGAVLTALTLAGSAFLAFGNKAAEGNRSATDSTKRSTTDIIASIEKQIEKLKERNKALAQSANPPPEPPAPAQQDLEAADKEYRAAIARAAGARTEVDRITFNELSRIAGEAYGRIYAAVQKLNAEQAENNRLTQQERAKGYLKEYATDAEKLAAELKKAKEELGAQFTPEIEKRIRERFKDKNADGAGRLALEKIRATSQAAVDGNKATLGELENQYDDALISIERFYAEKARLAQASIDAELVVARKTATTSKTPEDRVRAEAEVAALLRQRAQVVAEVSREQTLANQKVIDELEQVQIAVAEAGGNTAEATRLRAEQQYRELIARLTVEGNEAGVKLIKGLINTQVADAELKALSDKISATLAEARSKESLVAAQVDAGLTPAAEGERLLQQLREQTIEQLERYRLALAAIATEQQKNGGVIDPRVAEQIRVTTTEIANATAAQKTLKKQVSDAGESALTGFFTDLATGARSFGDAIKAAAVAFIQSLARMAAEALAKKAILSLAGPGGLLAGVLHSGGIVGQGGVSRMVNPLAFLAAPRYHSGGMVGLKPDERPAILQTGEEVLSRNDPRNQANNSAGSGYRIVNVLDPSLVSGYLESSQGERAILNVIGRNPAQVRQVIGA